MASQRTTLPSATYRLQFNADFTFKDAAALAPYLAELGISHCYASPYLKSRSGSPHGYDIVDHGSLNPDIGTREEYERFVDMLHEHGMGQILDLVSNHMGVGGNDNAWWLDVLENGPASRYARYFDIDWRPIKEELRGKILVPLLGDHYGTVLEGGGLELRFDAQLGEFSVHYYEHRFPIDPRTYPTILEHGLVELKESAGVEDPALLELQSLITAFHHLPARAEIADERLEERNRDKQIHKKHLAGLYADFDLVANHVDRATSIFRGEPGVAASFDPLHALLEEQAYRLSYWRVASDDINYRRFFDINDLAGLRMEDPEVFESTHRLILDMVASGRVDGLRIDHPDGLYDPDAYFRRLRDEMDAAANSGESRRRAYLVIEKILATYEHLPPEWPVDGTTGYEFLNLVNGLFIYPDSEQELTRVYSRFIGRRFDFDDVLYERKKLTIRVQLSSELSVLANMLDHLAENDRHTRDFTLNGLRDALTEIVACFPVYRTYIRPGSVSETDRRYVDWAIAQAKKRSPAGEVTIYDFIREVLLVQVRDADPYRRHEAAHLAMKFQQYTAPVMAKSLEDTAFYVYNRLTSLNEVGGDPGRFRVSIAAFHHNNIERSQNWPHAMLSSSTHDTKRSEDVRARIDVLSESPELWQRQLARWSRMNRLKKSVVEGRPAPSRNNEYFLYQTLFGTWPLHDMNEKEMDDFRGRIKGYLGKAVKEAKVHTSWLNPNVEYEESVTKFVETVLSGTLEQNAFLADFVPFQRRMVRFGLLNSLSQVLLKLTSPGIPDTYQGTELWDFSLVDPDNRRPVDNGHRRRLLSELIESHRGNGATLPRELMANIEDGRAKMFLIWKTLTARRQIADLFTFGDYAALTVEGDRSEHVCAFARIHEGTVSVSVAPRWYLRLTGGDDSLPIDPSLWEDTVIDLSPLTGTTQLRSLITDREHPVSDERPFIPVGELLGDFAVGLCVGRRNV